MSSPHSPAGAKGGSVVPLTPRSLPSVERCLTTDEGRFLAARYGRGVTGYLVREVIAELRAALLAPDTGSSPPVSADSGGVERILAAVELRAAALLEADGRRALNATGILLHTGLGRSPLPEPAADTLRSAARYSVVEVDRRTGDRSRRDQRVEQMLRELVGCEAAAVVNNNAAATFLVLQTLAAGKEAVISRGQLIEIGGSYRMPDVMALSGARLREVGTTNRTHLADYERAMGDETAVLVHVHTSNYRIQGFTSTPSVGELAQLAKRRGVPLFDDLGSGALISLQQFGLTDETMVRDSLANGADVVCFSGDKLISGPQAGIICGKRSIIEALRKNQFFRMFRVDKLTLGALERTLALFMNGQEGAAQVPLYRLLAASIEELEQRAEQCAAALRTISAPALGELEVSVLSAESYVGGGSLPDQAVPSRAVRVAFPGGSGPLGTLARNLRESVPAVFGRIQDGGLVFDMRTLEADEPELLVRIFRHVAESGHPALIRSV